MFEESGKRYKDSFTGSYEPCHQCRCGICSATAPTGHDMHDAVQEAYRAGYLPIQLGTIGDPMTWACPACRRERAKKSAG